HAGRQQCEHDLVAARAAHHEAQDRAGQCRAFHPEETPRPWQRCRRLQRGCGSSTGPGCRTAVCFLRLLSQPTRRPTMRSLACLFALLLTALPALAQDKKEVDLSLALAIDISGSIDPEEARLQREGYVQAFRDPVIVKAILGGPNGRIAVA